MGTYAWNTLNFKILFVKSRTQGPPSQAVHRNLATGPKYLSKYHQSVIDSIVNDKNVLTNHKDIES